MKQKSLRRRSFTLGDLVLAVGKSSRNSRECLAAVTDLFESGAARFKVGATSVAAHVR